MLMHVRGAAGVHRVLDDAGLQLHAHRQVPTKWRTEIEFKDYWADDMSAHLLLAAMLGRLTLSGPISIAPSPSTP